MKADEVCVECGVRESAHIDELQDHHWFLPAGDVECVCGHARRHHNRSSIGICYQCANEVPENPETERTKPWDHNFREAGGEGDEGMTARETWKASERRFAELLGGVRVPITGRGRGSAPDIAHERYAIEHKYGAVMSARMVEAVEQAEASAMESARQGLYKTPLVTIENVRRGRRGNGRFVLLKLEDFLEITSTGGTD